MNNRCERCGKEAPTIKVTIFHDRDDREVVMMCARCFHAAIRGEYTDDD